MYIYIYIKCIQHICALQYCRNTIGTLVNKNKREGKSKIKNKIKNTAFHKGFAFFCCCCFVCTDEKAKKSSKHSNL